MKDIHSDLKVVVAIAAEALAADNTPPAIDLQGYDAAELILAVGVGGITFSGTNKVEFKLTHSDDNSSYAAVEQDDVLGVTVASGGIIKALTSAHAAAAVYRAGYKGGKRYLKLLADFSGTHGTATPIAAVAVLGHGFNKPEADQA
jgi:hypothetical protein